MITEEERRLGERLFALPLPASTVDVAAAMTAGRRVRRMRAAMAGGLAVVAVTGVIGVGAVVRTRPDAPPAGPGVCRGETLPVPAGVYLDGVVDTDPTGRFVVGTVRSVDNTVTTAVRWDGGAVTVVPGEGRRSPTTVTADGVVLGLGPGGGGFRYAEGRVDPLPVPAGYLYATPRWFTGDGDPAGYAFGADGEPTARVVWRNGRPAEVTPVAAGFHQVSGDDGTTVWLSPDRARLAVTTPAGERRDLEIPAGYRPTHVLDVSGDRAVGLVQPENDPPVAGPGDLQRVVALRWTLSTGAVDWRGEPGTVASAVAVDGTMVLQDRSLAVRVRYPDGSARRLAPPAGMSLSEPVLSDDGGTVAAVAFVGDAVRGDRSRAVVYRC